MRSRRYWQIAVASAFFASCANAPLRAIAGGFSYTEDFSKFGKTMNFSCGGQNGVCGAVASMNSFTYLEGQYPGIYDNKLTPNKQADGTDTVDAQKWATDGWQVGSNPMRKGYYARTGTAEGDFIDTKRDWFNDYAPGLTVFDTWYGGSPDHDRKPTVDDLAGEMRDKEDVEFFIKGTSGTTSIFHVMTLTGVICDMSNMCSIKFQDPNDPLNEAVRAVTVNMGMIMFNDISGYPGTYTITAAFAESPKNVPEPATILMLATAGIGLVFYRRRS
jgi:PEP-CTERM motif-containing protein